MQKFPFQQAYDSSLCPFSDGDIPVLDACAGRASVNRLAAAGKAFFFLVDAWAKRWVVLEEKMALDHGFRWNLDGVGPLEPPKILPIGAYHRAFCVPWKFYQQAFALVHKGQREGKSYLANLTFPSYLETNFSINTLARCASAPFRLWLPDKLAIFSPERFVRISSEGLIASYPMKGTIDASLPNATERLWNNAKEAAEHLTIVDLIRNDLGLVARRIRVPRYRFFSKIVCQGKELLQMSSEICADLKEDWPSQLGDLLGQILPAGSVTGAPKKSSIAILRQAEGYERGWYSGIFGFFDGRMLDSAVMIRYVEKNREGSLIYKSGGGITIYSDAQEEYAELKAKIYVPVV